MDRDLTVGPYILHAREYDTATEERNKYGLSVYIIFDVPCGLWELLMPAGTIREKSRRDVDNLWGAFIWDDTDSLKSFITKISNILGINIHLANRYNVPPSVYNELTSSGVSWYGEGPDTYIKLVFYGNNF